MTMRLIILYIVMCVFAVTFSRSSKDIHQTSAVRRNLVGTDEDTERSNRDDGNRRRFTALWELDFMVGCTTGRGFIEAIYDYAWYGCYCGLGGKGVPVDETDRCCMLHDHCYDVAFHSRDCPLEPDVYFIPYKRHYHMTNCQTPDARITCDTPRSYPWWFPYPHCAAAICRCDAAVAMCLGGSRFNPENVLYPKYTCRKGTAPTIQVATDLVSAPNTLETTFATDTVTEFFEETTVLETTELTTNVNKAANDADDDVIDDVTDKARKVLRGYSRSRFLLKMKQYRSSQFLHYPKKYSINIGK
ncbi:putative phospholipase A2-like [Apostichopus japonicus]|uniref:Phospholipase A2 n=1 Tax=Stichopus japonicus TaxID=307972 RepID=A0A2G8LCL3_STIJA|nr:putative phospholipase A2-like [Apostichopus japonicus]